MTHPDLASLVHGLAPGGIEAGGGAPAVVVVDDAVDGVGGALVGHPEEALAVDNARNNLDELQEGRARQECVRARWNK